MKKPVPDHVHSLQESSTCGTRLILEGGACWHIQAVEKAGIMAPRCSREANWISLDSSTIPKSFVCWKRSTRAIETTQVVWPLALSDKTSQLSFASRPLPPGKPAPWPQLYLHQSQDSSSQLNIHVQKLCLPLSGALPPG